MTANIKNGRASVPRRQGRAADADQFKIAAVQTAQAQLLKPDCNLSTVTDGRGAIFSFKPVGRPIQEWTFLFLNAGKVRGHHCHPEFDEYLMLTSGSAVDVFKDAAGKESFFKLDKGDCVFIPSGVYHTLTAITDCEAVALLTKRWDDCEKPIVQEVVA